MAAVPEGGRKGGCSEGNVSRFEALDGLLEGFSHSLLVKGAFEGVSDENQSVATGVGEEAIEEERLGRGDGRDIVSHMLREIGVAVDGVLLGSCNHEPSCVT